MSSGKQTQFHCNGNLELVRITLSDGSVLEGDSMPKLSFQEQAELLNHGVRRQKAELASKVHDIFLDVVKRKLTVDDVAVLTERAIRGQKIDGMQAAFFVLVGMRVERIAQRSRGGSKPKKPPAVIDTVEEMLRMGDSTGAIIKKVEQMGQTFSRTSIAKRRNKQKTK